MAASCQAGKCFGEKLMEMKKGSVQGPSLLSEGPIACLILCRVCDTTVECFQKVALCRLCNTERYFCSLPRYLGCFFLLCLRMTFYWGIVYSQKSAAMVMCLWMRFHTEHTCGTSVSSVSRTWPASRRPPWSPTLSPFSQKSNCLAGF